MEKYSRTGQATDDNAHCMDARGYKHILREYVIIIAFPLQQCLHERSTMLTLYVHCLPVLLKFRVVLNSAILIDVTRFKLCAGVPHSNCVGEVATRHGEPTVAIYADVPRAVVL